MGKWSDKVGRKPLIVWSRVALAIVIYPCFLWLISSPTPALDPWTADTAYLNFAETRRDPAALYEPDTLRRLRAVKAACDPTDVILSVADVYQTLRAERAYRPAFSHRQALEILGAEVERGWWDQTVVGILQSLPEPAIAASDAF